MFDIGIDIERGAQLAGRASHWLRDAVAAFGSSCRAKLAGPGDREASIRSPLEDLLRAAGSQLGVPAVFHDEVRDSERRVRPDYGISVNGAITGYVEVKAPKRPIDPARLRGHDLVQWERQRDLPNLVYTNGTEWRLYRDGELAAGPAFLAGDLASGDGGLEPSAGFEAVLTDFLRWKPAPITSVSALVRSVAPLTRLLRGEVLDQLAAERRAVKAGADEASQPFLGLARDWRALLFPQAGDAKFADGYAQAVTFALLLARTESIELVGVPLHQIGAELGSGHTLMGKALQLLTDDVAADFKVTLDLLVRVVGAVDWPRVRRGRHDMYLHLYEHFLDLYDADLRKASGSYYTPREVVEHMVRLAEEVLAGRLGKPTGFRDPDVLTVDPAMGTGTYLHTILEHVAEAAKAADGPGAVRGALAQAAERLVGFELQMGPYAVAELRTADLLAAYGASPPPSGMHLYVTDTLDDPHAAQTQIAAGLRLIARSRREANEIKARANVTVVIGNPPYKELAVGEGGWVENGGLDHGANARGILEDYYTAGAGRFKAKLKNLYVYFWRWGTWKVWESTPTEPDGCAGIVCYISTSGYLTGPAFTGMREHLRRHASEGWIIDLTPEGQTPEIPTRIFPGVRQPLAIGLFVRAPETGADIPATIHYRSLSGRQADKFQALGKISLDDDGWREVRAGWTAPFTPAATGSWDEYPALADLLPWYSPGVFPTRTWVYAPCSVTLRNRWDRLVNEPDPGAQSALFKESHDAGLDKSKPPLPSADTHQGTATPLRRDRTTRPRPVRVGYRAFDRQWIIPDSRVIDRPRRDLWASRVPGQVFTIEQHRQLVQDGPGLVFSALIPDFDYFKGSEGGRTLPFLHPDGSANLAAGLLAALNAGLARHVSARDVLAYVAGVAGHPAFTRMFADELTTPGIRIPITRDPELWDEAVRLGEQVIWLHTYGDAYAGDGRPHNDVRLPHGDARQPLSTKPVTDMPDATSYDQAGGVIVMGDGEFGPVPPQVWNYVVGGRNIVRSWFNYRKRNPGGKKGSPLDNIHIDVWDPDWTHEFIDLLTVLTRLVDIEQAQEQVLTSIMAGPVLTTTDLQNAGVRWPATDTDRKPRYSLASLVVGADPQNGQPALEL